MTLWRFMFLDQKKKKKDSDQPYISASSRLFERNRQAGKHFPVIHTVTIESKA